MLPLWEEQHYSCATSQNRDQSWQLSEDVAKDPSDEGPRVAVSWQNKEHSKEEVVDSRQGGNREEVGSKEEEWMKEHLTRK